MYIQRVHKCALGVLECELIDCFLYWYFAATASLELAISFCLCFVCGNQWDFWPCEIIPFYFIAFSMHCGKCT